MVKKKQQIVRTRPMCWIAIGFLLIIAVMLWGRSYRDVLPFLEPGVVILEGNIDNKQYREFAYGAYWQVTLKNVKVSFEEDVETLEGKYLCQISAKEDVRLKIGQIILLEGTYAAWEESANPGQFDTGKYYVSQGILGQFKKCKIIKQGKSFSGLREKMWQFRQVTCTFLIRELGEEDGRLMCAMLLGEKSGLDEEQKSLYQRNGISHILAISGLHLTLLGMSLYRVLKIILTGNRQASVAVIIIMSLYCIFTGNSISTIRATIMFVLSFIAEILGRSYDSLSALGIAAILQLFINPYVINNSGFLLSFLAVIGVTFLAPRLQELLETKRKITKSLCVSLSASVTTLPVLLWNYGTYLWYSVFLNFLILPVMSLLLFLAVILVLLSLLKTPILLAGELAWIWRIQEGMIKGVVWGIKLILEYVEICCRIFERMGYQDRYIGAPTMFQIILYICLIGLAISKIFRHSSLGRKMILLSAVSILSINQSFGAEITMLDVGQGDGIVICNDNGNVYISDFGSSSVSQVGEYRLLPFLKQKGYGKIKGVFMSHLDEDHISGILELLELAPQERIEIEYIFFPQSALGIADDWGSIKQIQKLAKQNGAELVYLAQSDLIVDGKMEFICLYPESEIGLQTTENRMVIGETDENRNNQSMVLLLKYKDFDMLLTGDIEKAGELKIIEEIDRMSLDVLKVAHHGSSGSSCEEFLEKINPKLSLLSCGKNNSYGHPHEETLERLEAVDSKIMSTVESGAITLKVGRKIKVYEFKK